MFAGEGVTGVSPAHQVMAFYREELARRGFLDSQALGQVRSGQRVQVAGLVVHQAPPTAKGFHFITLEDEKGMVNVVVRPRVVTQTKKWPFRPTYGLTGTILLVEGIVQRQDHVVNILATHLSPLTFADPDRASLP